MVTSRNVFKNERWSKASNSLIMIIDDKKAMLIIHVCISNFRHKNRSSQARGPQFEELREPQFTLPIR